MTDEVVDVRSVLLREFSRFDKALALYFLKNSNGPTYFNQLNEQIRPRIMVKALQRMKLVWRESWNVWKLEDDLLIDIWFKGDQEDGKFHNDDRVKLRMTLMEDLNRRAVEFDKRLYALGDEAFHDCIIKNKGDVNWFDPHDKWMDTSGFDIQQDIKRRRKDLVMGVLGSKPENEGNIYSINRTNSVKSNKEGTATAVKKLLGRNELKQRNVSMLERIRAKEVEQKAKQEEIAQMKKKKAQQSIHDQFMRIYSIVYEQAPKFGGNSTGMSVDRLKKLVEDSATMGLESQDFLQVVKQITERVPGISLVSVGDLKVVKIGKLDLKRDLEFLK